MEQTFDSVLAFTQLNEGGYVDDPKDAGNWTGGHVHVGRLVGSNMGVGAPALVSWMGAGVEVTSMMMRGLPRATYVAIARARYWRPMGCAQLPAGVDCMVFDYGWNRGDATSVRLLQSLIGVPIDGDCGPGTIERVNGCHVAGLIADLADAQESAYRKLYNFATYGRGWIARTIQREVKAQALRTAAVAPAAPAV